LYKVTGHRTARCPSSLNYASLSNFVGSHRGISEDGQLARKKLGIRYGRDSFDGDGKDGFVAMRL
jgi:hypothetical protein